MLAPNKEGRDVHQSGEQFDAPNMLVPSGVCLVPLARTVRFLLPSHAKTGMQHTILQRSLGRLGLRQAVSWGCSVSSFLWSGQLCRPHTHCPCILTHGSAPAQVVSNARRDVNNSRSPRTLDHVKRANSKDSKQ